MEKRNGLATAGMVLGIIAISTSWIPIINNLSFVLGILALIFGFITSKKAKKGIALTAILTGAFALIITLRSQQAFSDSLDKATDDLNKMTGENTEEILENDINVEIGQFDVSYPVTTSKILTDTKLPVKITNTSKETHSFSVLIQATNSKGDRILDDYAYVNNLTPGQSQEVNIFTFVESNTLKEMEKATFTIIEIEMY